MYHKSLVVNIFYLKNSHPTPVHQHTLTQKTQTPKTCTVKSPILYSLSTRRTPYPYSNQHTITLNHAPSLYPSLSLSLTFTTVSIHPLFGDYISIRPTANVKRRPVSLSRAVYNVLCAKGTARWVHYKVKSSSA